MVRCDQSLSLYISQLVEGTPLPPPERLKRKILIKDKKVRGGVGGNSSTSLGGLSTGTLQRGTHLPSVPEEMEVMANENKTKSPEVINV